MAKAKAAPKRPAGVGPAATWDGEVWREGEFWFDEVAADKAAGFFPKYLRLSEGEWAGQPFHLAGWQENDIIRPLFGWKCADGTRRYRRCFVWVPRKNGKTELAAGVALLALLGDGEPAGQVFSIASDASQAALVFTKATNMVARSPWMSENLTSLKNSIYCPQLNASFRPLSGKPTGKHGLSMSGLVGDEIHEWRSGDLYTFVHDSAAARRQPIEFLISTAGTKGTHGEEVYEECVRIKSGEVEDPSTLVVIYAADAEDDWTKPEVWAKANPNLNVSVKLEGPSGLAAACRLAQQLPRLENDFKRYRLNMWTEQAVRWLPIAGIDDEGRRFGWDHCVGPVSWQAMEASLFGRRAFGGLDLSATQDLSAWVLWFPGEDPNDLPKVLARFFKPADLIKAHTKRDRVPYDRWVQEGALIATPGNVIDYAFIREQIFRDAERYRIANIGIDRWNATQMSVELMQEGLPVEFFGQGFASLSAPSKELERLVLSNGFEHGGHPILRRHAQAVAVETDAAGNIKPAKSKSAQRIDGIAGLVTAIGVSDKDQGPAPVSPWEDPNFSIGAA